jgi:hypothetical protein
MARRQAHTQTIAIKRWFGSCSLKANEIIKMATGLNALSIWMKLTDSER